MCHKVTVHTCSWPPKTSVSFYRQAFPLISLELETEGVTVFRIHYRMGCFMQSLLTHMSIRLHYCYFQPPITYATRCQVPTLVWTERKYLQTCYVHTLKSWKTSGLAEEFVKVAGKLSVVMLMVFFFPCLDSFSSWGCVTTNRTDSAKKKHISPRSCLYVMMSIACDGIIAVRSRYLVLPIPCLFSEWKKGT